MEAKTHNTEVTEFMHDILAGNAESLKNYITSVDLDKVCENIYKLAEYANDITNQADDSEAKVFELKEEARKLKNDLSMYNFYKEGYHNAHKQVKDLKAIVKAMSAIVTE